MLPIELATDQLPKLPEQFPINRSIYLTVMHELKRKSKAFRKGYSDARTHGTFSAVSLSSEKLTSPILEKIGALMFGWEHGDIHNFIYDRRNLTITATNNTGATIYTERLQKGSHE